MVIFIEELAFSQRSHTVSITLCHGGWTPAPLSAHLSTGWESTTSQIKAPIYTRHTTIHHFIWWQQQKFSSLGASLMACGVVG